MGKEQAAVLMAEAARENARLAAVVEKTRTTDAERSLLLLYEKTPCSNCRRWFVRLLAEMKMIPDWMRAECRYDANGGTVEVVERDVKLVEKG